MATRSGASCRSESPALPFAAAVGGAALWAGRRRLAGALLVAAVAAGVLWSNALAYRDVNLAPRDQPVELETITAPTCIRAAAATRARSAPWC